MDKTGACNSWEEEKIQLQNHISGLDVINITDDIDDSMVNGENVGT